MPTYEYLCKECDLIHEQIHSMLESPEFKCSECGSIMERQISHNCNFIIKGESVSKDWKEERFRIKKSAGMGVKQIDRWGTGGQALRPNVAGVETDSWSDAAKLAKEAGINTDTYQPMIKKEKTTSKTSGINDTAWKKAKAIKENF